jgi:hypothetical protein
MNMLKACSRMSSSRLLNWLALNLCSSGVKDLNLSLNLACSPLDSLSHGVGSVKAATPSFLYSSSCCTANLCLGVKTSLSTLLRLRLVRCPTRACLSLLESLGVGVGLGGAGLAVVVVVTGTLVVSTSSVSSSPRAENFWKSFSSFAGASVEAGASISISFSSTDSDTVATVVLISSSAADTSSIVDPAVVVSLGSSGAANTVVVATTSGAAVVAGGAATVVLATSAVGVP